MSYVQNKVDVQKYWCVELTFIFLQPYEEEAKNPECDKKQN